MTRPRDWKLVFTCPACSRAGEVAAAKLTAVVHCPYCRTKVVVERDGMRKARKRSRRTRHARQAKPRSSTSGQARRRVGNLGLVWAGLVSVLVAAGVLAILSSSKQRAPDEQRVLRSAAEQFQSAWLDQDLDTAASFVLGSDRDRFPQWSAPRRAALVAGFGAEFRGRVTTVEIVNKDANDAVVRVAFEIRGRKQQAFQDWKLVDGSWRLSLRHAGRP